MGFVDDGVVLLPRVLPPVGSQLSRVTLGLLVIHRAQRWACALFVLRMERFAVT